MELRFKQHLHPTVLFLLILTVPTIIGAECTIVNEEYLQTENVWFNFTRSELGTKRNPIHCSRACSEDSSCLGVGIQKETNGGVTCFKMINDSVGNGLLQDELVYLKGKILNK